MSNATAEPTVIPVQDREVIVFTAGRFTSEEIDFAKAEGLDRLDTLYVLDERPRLPSFRTPAGVTFRDAGMLYVRTGKDGVRRFVAYVYPDSTNYDFEFFDRAIVRARYGRMEGWVRHTFKDGTEGWWFQASLYSVDGITDPRPASVIITDESETPRLKGSGSTWGYPCEEPRCREEFHDREDPSHTLESLENDFSGKGGYEIEICKDPTRPESRWYVNLWMSEDLTELTPEDVAKFANDLQWMGIECATANAKQQAKVTA